MKPLYQIWLLIAVCNFATSCNGQTRQANDIPGKNQSFSNAYGDDEYYGIVKKSSSSDTSSAWKEGGQQILLTGIVYQLDGKTPAPDVLLYYYQTNTDGKYLHRPDDERSMQPNELGQTHGYIRGWVKTDSAGKYHIYTIRPAAYPTNDEPAHIHMTVKEPNELAEYYIDDFVFDDDKLVTSAKRKKMENRCGSGVLRMVKKGNLLVGERNLILGLNIPAYPEKK